MESPQPKSLEFRELRLRYYEFTPRRSSSRVPLILLHANGYSALTYTPLIERLVRSGYPVFALDFAGHGESQVSFDFSDWNFFRDQALALREAIDRDVVWVGHSLGGASALLASAAAPENTRATILFDPTVGTAFRSIFMPIFSRPMVKQALARRARFKTKRAITRSYRMSPSFRDWTKESFQAYLDSAIRPADDGQGFELCLPPEMEAKIFGTLHRGQWREFRKIETPICVTYGSAVCPPVAAKRLASMHTESEQHAYRQRSHFFPMEEPDWTFARTNGFLEKLEAKQII